MSRKSSYTYKGKTYTNTYDDSGRKLNSSVSSSSSSSSSSSGRGETSRSNKSYTGGYGSGRGYGNRETQYTFNDGQVVYSNATRWEDAAREAGNTSGLRGAVSYMTGKSADDGLNTSFTDSTYTRNSPRNEKSYNNAMRYESDLMNSAQNGAFSGNFNYNPSYIGDNANIKSSTLSEIKSAYGDIYDMLESQSRNVEDYQNALFKNQASQINQNYDDLQRQAYVNNYLTQNKLKDSLLEQGIKGGLSETTMLKARSDYENRFDANEKARASALQDADMSRQKAIFDAQNTLLGQKAGLAQNALSTYLSALDDERDYEKWLYEAAQAQSKSQLAYEQALAESEQDALYDLARLAISANDAEGFTNLTGLNGDYLAARRQTAQNKNVAKSTKKTKKSTVKSTTKNSQIETIYKNSKTADEFMENVRKAIQSGKFTVDEYRAWYQKKGGLSF